MCGSKTMTSNKMRVYFFCKTATLFLPLFFLFVFVASATSMHYEDFEEFPSSHSLTTDLAEKRLRQQQQLESFMQFYNQPEVNSGEPHPNFTDIEQPTPCDPGEPLLLQTYVDSGRVAEGRAAAVVDLPNASAADAGAVDAPRSYSGFLTVNRTDNGALFFWLFETVNKSVSAPEQRPLLIWLQGGPGASSLYGLFVLNGIFGVDVDGALYRRTHYSWLETANMLYIDQPVGTGFSYTGSDDGYAKSQVQVGWNLWEFMQQFYKLFPNFLQTELYITGESYAGKWVPTFAYRVHERNMATDNPPGTLKIPLAGLAVGNGLSDPEHMIEGLGPLMFNFGMATQAEREYFDAETLAVREMIQAKKFYDARRRFADLFTGGSHGSYFTNISGSTNYYNILLSTAPPEEVYYQAYLTRCDVRRAIHVGNLSYGGVLTTARVKYFLDDDFLDTIRHWLPPLLDNYRVLYYNGQLDVIVGVPITERFLRLLDNWTWKDEYLNADRIIWKVGDEKTDPEVAGYVKEVRNSFYQVVLRGAGHMVPHDQPQRGFDMIQRFIERRSFGTKLAARFNFDEYGAWILRDL